MPLFKKRLHSSHVAERRRKVLIARGVIFFVMVAIVVGAGAWVSSLAKFQVQGIELKGNHVVSDSDLRAYVTSKLSGKYVWLFSRRNIAIYPRSSIEQSLLTNFKRFSSVEVSTKNTQTITVTVTERKPQYLWCGDSYTADPVGDTPSVGPSQDHATVSPSCYFVDDLGYVFAVAPYFSADVYVTFYGPLLPAASSSDPLISAQAAGPAGRYVMDTTQFKHITDLVGLLRDIHLEPEKVTEEGSGDYSIILRGGGALMVNSSQDFNKVSNNVDSALGSEPFKSMQRASVGTAVEYIDVRFGNKFIYKLKEKNSPKLPAIASSTTPQ